MKHKILFVLFSLFIASCSNPEIENLKKENALLSQQIADLQQGKIRQPLTAPTQKAGFCVPKTVLRLMKHSFFKLSFVVKAPPFG